MRGAALSDQLAPLQDVMRLDDDARVLGDAVALELRAELLYELCAALVREGARA